MDEKKIDKLMGYAEDSDLACFDELLEINEKLDVIPPLLENINFKDIEQLKGEKGDKGDQGEKGETGEQGPAGKDGIDGVDGKDGKDGVDGIDGKDGIDGQDGAAASVVDVVNYIESLEGDDRIDKKAIKGLEALDKLPELEQRVFNNAHDVRIGVSKTELKALENRVIAVENTESSDVSGPTSSTDNAIARFHEATGKVIQNSLVTIDDDGNMSMPSQINFTSAVYTQFQATQTAVNLEFQTKATDGGGIILKPRTVPGLTLQGDGVTFFGATATTQGAFKYDPNASNQWIGIYDSGNALYYGISRGLPATSGTSTIGGYYAGLGIGAGTDTGAGKYPVFGVLMSDQSGNGIGNVALTVFANNFIETKNSVLDNGSGSMVVGDGTVPASAKLTVTSTTQGFLPPRMTEAQRDAISSPAAGLIIYNTTTGKLNVRGASAWEAITSS